MAVGGLILMAAGARELGVTSGEVWDWELNLEFFKCGEVREVADSRAVVCGRR